jgi:hypothetical protein
MSWLAGRLTGRTFPATLQFNQRHLAFLRSFMLQRVEMTPTSDAAAAATLPPSTARPTSRVYLSVVCLRRRSTAAGPLVRAEARRSAGQRDATRKCLQRMRRSGIRRAFGMFAAPTSGIVVRVARLQSTGRVGENYGYILDNASCIEDTKRCYVIFTSRYLMV